ncbi:MAG: uracil-DNA glycosylase [Aquiluna sp.]|nr:uracil-DNA glycosylase [Aquiluna sp.]MCF8545326.1 uracil-DNA glycosylase [Aquiluna sp.]
MPISQMHQDWQELLAPQLPKLAEVLELVEAKQDTVPKAENILRVFEISPKDYRVLILGQDPYPTPGHAIGLAFAVPEGTRPLPPTLTNIFKELRSDLGDDMVLSADISPWSQRGVMLLNRHLTTDANNTAAHLDFGWAEITQAAVSALYKIHGDVLVSILWGQKALELKPFLGSSRIIQSAHPSPLSSYRGFFGSRPFSECNKALLESGLDPIDWSA